MTLLFLYPYRLGVVHVYLIKVFTIHTYTTEWTIDKAEDEAEKVLYLTRDT